MSTQSQGNKEHGGYDEHFILPEKTAWKIFFALIVLTGITVGLSYVHLGPFNYVIGMVVAAIKASLVIWFFMTLGFDKRSNMVIFATGFTFVAIFFGLVYPDLFYRGDVAVKGPLLRESGGPKISKPWEPRDEVLAHGKTVFQAQCTGCHGAEGKGDGPAAASLNPHPRNFTADVGWKNGRKPSQIFKTLKEGIPGSGMASFATLPATTRWALSNYVASLGPNRLQDTPEDLKAQGVDPASEGAGGTEEKSIAVSDAMKLEAVQSDSNVNVKSEDLESYSNRLKAKTFSKQPLKAEAR